MLRGTSVTLNHAAADDGRDSEGPFKESKGAWQFNCFKADCVAASMIALLVDGSALLLVLAGRRKKTPAF